MPRATPNWNWCAANCRTGGFIMTSAPMPRRPFVSAATRLRRRHFQLTATISPRYSRRCLSFARILSISGARSKMLFQAATLTARDEGSWCEFGLTFAEMPKRVFGAHELSDGTLKYLCLLGALMGYRLPSLIALNEPEASLHPDLLPPLARLLAKAAKSTRVWIVTHSHALADALRKEAGAQPRTVTKEAGATAIEGLRPWGEYKDEED